MLLRPYKNGLVLHYVYYANEVRAFDEVDTGATGTFTPVESNLADKLIEQLTTDGFEPDRYRDTYTDRVREAIEQKVAGQQIHVSHQQPTAQIIDLFEALKRSLKTDSAPEQASAAEVAQSLKTNSAPGQSNAEVAAQAPAASKAKPPKKAEPRAQRRASKATG